MRLIRLAFVALAPAFIGLVPALLVLGIACVGWLFGRGGRESLWLGALWTVQLTRLALDHQTLWPLHLSGAERSLNVRLESIVTSRGQGFGPARVVDFEGDEVIGKRIWLSWTLARWQPVVGETWAIRARLKPLAYSPSLRGDPLANALGSGFFAKARLANGQPESLSAPAISDSLRAWLSRRLDHAGDDAAVLARAIAFGQRPDFDHTTWAAVEQSGLAHLFSPSGLHVGIAVALVVACWPSPARLIGGAGGQRWAWVVGAVFVWWLLPTRLPISRAAMACVLWAAAQRTAVGFPATRIYWLVLLVCALIWPWLALQPGAQMSFLAVGWILIALQCPVPAWRRGLAMVMGLSASTAWAGLPLGLASVPSNLVWVPLLSLVGVPALVFGWVSDSWWAWNGFAQGLMAYLAWLPNFSLSLTQSLGLTLASVALLFPAAAVLVVLIPFCVPARPAAQLSVYSVGAGQAISLVTANHAVVFDLGNAQPNRQGRIARELQPDLVRAGIRSLDLVLLSHGDADHAAGLDGFRARFGIAQLLSGEPDGAGGAGACYRGQQWQFDAVRVRVLWGGPPASKNAASCAVELTGAFGRIWILGDLPARQQWALARVEGTPRLTGLVAAHHGARDGFSSDLAALQSPGWVIFSQARLGRWAHPAPLVERGWRAGGADTWRTGSTGTVRIDLSGDGRVHRPARESRWALGYWTSG